MKESFYFTHDFNAHDDIKIKRLLRKHGTRGYGIYWYLIELLASETEKWYLPKDYDGIAFDMREECDRIKSVIEDFELFDVDDKNFWNKRLDKHFDERAEKSEKARKNAEKRWKKQERKNAAAMQPQCNRNAIKERKGKDIKEKTENQTEDGKWFDENCPTVQSLQTPIDDKLAEWFIQNYPQDVIEDVFESMENTADLKKKYRSAKTTAVNWLKRRGWISKEKMKNLKSAEAREFIKSGDVRAVKLFESVNPELFYTL